MALWLVRIAERASRKEYTNEAGTGYKLYAPGIGLIQDGALKLVKYGHLHH